MPETRAAVGEIMQSLEDVVRRKKKEGDLRMEIT